jgi:hypothetical protein
VDLGALAQRAVEPGLRVVDAAVDPAVVGADHHARPGVADPVSDGPGAAGEREGDAQRVEPDAGEGDDDRLQAHGQQRRHGVAVPHAELG